MKAISIRQPWAGLIAWGIKTIETRNWKTTYRGPLAIHASKAADNCVYPKYMFPTFVEDHRGVILAVCALVDIKEYKFYPDFCEDRDFHYLKHIYDCDKKEVIYPRYGWILEDVKPFKTPIPWRGMPGLFEVEV